MRTTDARTPRHRTATAAHPIDDAKTFFDPNVVKVVLDARGRAQYFSRAPIPFARDAFAASRDRLPEGFPAYRHIGLREITETHARMGSIRETGPWGAWLQSLYPPRGGARLG